MGDFNIKLQSRIKEMGLKNYEVAYSCRMHESDLSRVINGRRKPDEEEKSLLCKILKCLPEDIGLT